jgi:hypothetical protein
MTHAYRCCEHAKEIQNDSKKLFVEEIVGRSGNNFLKTDRLFIRASFASLKLRRASSPASANVDS